MQLHKKNILIPLNCESCQCLSEDAVHLFFNCPFTRHHIKAQDQHLITILDSINTDNITMKQILPNLNSKMSKSLLITLAMTWWALWMFRNQTLFQTNNDNKIENLGSFIHNIQKNWKKTKFLNSYG